jgi:hypothetical protein
MILARGRDRRRWRAISQSPHSGSQAHSSFHLPESAPTQRSQVVAVSNHDLDDLRYIRCPSTPTTRFPLVVMFACENRRGIGRVLT